MARPSKRWTVLFAASLLFLSSPAVTLSALARTSLPDLEYYHVRGIPLDGYDAPSISNNWLWAQATTRHGGSLLNMEDIQAGGEPQFSGSTVVLVDGKPLQASPATADWWPNRVVRRATIDGVEYVGTVLAAARRYALLGRLTARNKGTKPRTIRLEIRFIENGGLHATVETPRARERKKDGIRCQFGEVTLLPGETRLVRTVNLYRSSAGELERIVARFDDEWAASNRYWNDLITDAFTPSPGPYLSGGVPRLETRESDVQRLYNFGVMNALLLMKNDPDNQSGHNLYVTAMPDASYGKFCYMWDLGYASEILSMLDPEGLRTIIERWSTVDIHSLLAVAYNDPQQAFGPGTFYASSRSSYFLSTWNYINYTGDYDFLDKEIAGRSMLEHLRRAIDWHRTRPRWNGLAHYGQEDNLFDAGTVQGYDHWVAAPNAADVWIHRALADIYETLYRDASTARELRAEADRIAKALIENLYNTAPGFEGTWKQRHEDGSFTSRRHSWDFMLTGSFLTRDLSATQKQQMRDWFMQNLVRVGSSDVWIVAQDPRDGNNGEHQMEHNGRGAYPAWPYHDGWSLHAMGFHQDVVDLLRILDGAPAMGAIGQGYHPSGRRCRSNWVNVAGSSQAAYTLHNVFDVWPGLGEFRPQPQLADFDPGAFFENVPVKGVLYRVSAAGAVATGKLQQASEGKGE